MYTNTLHKKKPLSKSPPLSSKKDKGGKKITNSALFLQKSMGNQAVGVMYKQANKPACDIQTIDTALKRAVKLLDTVISSLENNRRLVLQKKPSILSSREKKALLEKLGVDVTQSKVWTRRAPRTIKSVLRWYKNIKKLLTSGRIRYDCSLKKCEKDTYAWVYVGSVHLHLCNTFWQVSLDEQAMTLIHEASHIYYGTEDEGKGLGSAYCMEGFICDVNNISVCFGCD